MCAFLSVKKNYGKIGLRRAAIVCWPMTNLFSISIILSTTIHPSPAGALCYRSPLSRPGGPSSSSRACQPHGGGCYPTGCCLASCHCGQLELKLSVKAPASFAINRLRDHSHTNSWAAVQPACSAELRQRHVFRHCGSCYGHCDFLHHDWPDSLQVIGFIVHLFLP